MHELYPHQKAKLERNPPQCLIPYGTGVGKTLTAIELAHLNKVDCLIVCPKAQKKMWIRETAEYPEKHLIITKEEFKRDAHLVGRYEGIIVDEAHHFTGKSGFREILAGYIKHYNPKYRWLLTATPYRSSPWNVQRLAEFLGRPLPYKEFIHRFFHEIDMGGNPNNPGYKKKVVLFIKSDIEKDIAKWVNYLACEDVVALRDVVKVPEQKIETIYVGRTKEQEKAIADLEDTNFIQRFTHMHCIDNGLLSGDGYVDNQTFECEKNAKILEIVAANDRVAILCRYNSQISLIEDLITNPTRPPRKVFIINGAVKDRDALVLEIEACREPLVVLIQSQCSEGYELTSISHIIFASLSWSYLDYVQAQGGESGGGRFLRINKLKPNWYYHIVVKGGVDEEIYQCIMKKQDFDAAIYDRKTNKAGSPHPGQVPVRELW